MEALLAALESHGILYAFPHLIPFNSAGALPLAQPGADAGLPGGRRAAWRPRSRSCPGSGGCASATGGSASGTIDLGDLGQRQRIVAECRGLIDEGFDGIHLNVEPVDDGNDDFLALLRALRTAVGPDQILSLSAIRPGPFAIPAAPNFLWTPAYYAPRGRHRRPDRGHGLRHRACPRPSLYRRYAAWAAATVTRSLVERRSSGARPHRRSRPTTTRA